jgi:hypothetical protein
MAFTGDISAMRNSLLQKQSKVADSIGVEVDISDDARTLLARMSKEDIEKAEQKRQEEFYNHPSFGLELFKGAERFEYASRLYDAAYVRLGDTKSNSIQRLANLANKYDELKKSIEAQFSGEELEKELGLLSEAFDIATDFYAKGEGMRAHVKLQREMLAMSAHNQLIKQGQPGLFKGGAIEFDKEELLDFSNRIVAGIEKSISLFARITKQFVSDNGRIVAEQGSKELEALLKSVGQPEGGFSFDELNSINDVFNKEQERRLEHERKYIGTLQPLPPRNETMFAELKRVLGL